MLRLKMTPQMQSPWRLLLGLLCLGLVLFSGTLAVTHTHAQGAVHSDCGLCAVAHTTAHILATPVYVPVTQVVTRLVVAVAVPRSRTLSRFALFTRPPPVYGRA